MKKILVFTTSRADFGLLKNLILKLRKNYKTEVVVSGTHLSKNFGYTLEEIKDSKINIYKSIKWKNFEDSYLNITKNFSYTLVNASKILNTKKFDLIFLLGDRYETLSVAIAAHLARIPIAHIHGGEVTSGIIDDAFRHSITKLSHLHFVSHKDYKNRVAQLGEDKKNIHIVGGLGIDSIKNTKLLKRSKLEKILGIKFLKKNIIINFHPETLNPNQAKKQINEILGALDSFKDINKIFTMPGADLENSFILKKIKSYVFKNKNSFIFKSLGQEVYLSLLNQIDFMLGNSSSGILEMPYFKKVTINLGERQTGRIKSKSIIETRIEKNEIVRKIHNFYNGKYKINIKRSRNLFGKGNSSNKIIKILKKKKIKNLIKKKRFIDLKI